MNNFRKAIERNGGKKKTFNFMEGFTGLRSKLLILTVNDFPFLHFTVFL